MTAAWPKGDGHRVVEVMRMERKFFKDVYSHRIKNALADDYGALDFTLKWLSFDAVVFPSGKHGHTGKLRVSADGFTPTTFTFVADNVDWKMSV